MTLEEVEASSPEISLEGVGQKQRAASAGTTESNKQAKVAKPNGPALEELTRASTSVPDTDDPRSLPLDELFCSRDKKGDHGEAS